MTTRTGGAVHYELHPPEVRLLMAIMRVGGQSSPRPGGVPPAAAQLFHGAGAGFSAPWRGTKSRRQGRAAVSVGPGGSRTTTPARGEAPRGLGRRRGRVDRFLLRGRRRRGARRRGAARAWRPWGAYGAPARAIGPRAPHTPRARVQQALKGLRASVLPRDGRAVWPPRRVGCTTSCYWYSYGCWLLGQQQARAAHVGVRHARRGAVHGRHY